MAVPTVDAHAHAFLAASPRYPRDIHAMFPAELAAPVEILQEEMARNGIEKAVLVPLSSEDDYLRECLQLHPDMFAGIGVADPGARSPAEDLRRRAQDSGLSGLRVHHLGEPDAAAFESSPEFELLEALAEEALLLWYYAPADQLGLLEIALERLPALDVVLNHLGFPMPAAFEIDELGRPAIASELPPPTLAAVEALARFERVNVMFSGEYAFSREAFPFDDVADVVRRLHRAFGPDRMLWASDFPWVREVPGYAAQLELVDLYLPELEPSARAAIMGGTAARLLGF